MSSHHEAGCCSHEENHHHNHAIGEFNWRQAVVKIAVVCLLLIIGLVFQSQLQATSYHWGLYAVLVPAYLISGWGVVGKLKSLGVNQVVMLTGDRHSEAEKVARLLKLDRYEAALLPEDKVSVLEKLL